MPLSDTQPSHITVSRTQDTDEAEQLKTIAVIRQLLAREAFGVLATTENDHPHTCLISFAENTSLNQLVFATPRDTKKFKMIQANSEVSILVDNRDITPEDIDQLAALTISGHAQIVDNKTNLTAWQTLLRQKHPYLATFIQADTTEFIVVTIDSYYYVTRFQKGTLWLPESPKIN